MKGRRTYRVTRGCDLAGRAAVTPADRRTSSRDRSDAIPPRLAPRWNSLRAQKEKNSERVLGIKIEKETNMKGQRTVSPRAVIPSPDRKGSDAIPVSLAPRWNSVRAQKKKKEARTLGIKYKKRPMLRDDVPRPPRL